MRGIAIDFEWARFDDYHVELEQPHPDPESASLISGASIGPRLVAFGESVITRPLDNYSELYLELAKAAPTIEGQREFAGRYGLLKDREREETMYWANSVWNMRKLVAMMEKRENWEMREGKYVPYEFSNSLALRYDLNAETNSLSMHVVPKNLFIALALQCVSHRADGVQIRVCKSCGALFEAGGVSGRRFHAEFCSDKCRYQFNHRNRRKKQ